MCGIFPIFIFPNLNLLNLITSRTDWLISPDLTVIWRDYVFFLIASLPDIFVQLCLTDLPIKPTCLYSQFSLNLDNQQPTWSLKSFSWQLWPWCRLGSTKDHHHHLMVPMFWGFKKYWTQDSQLFRDLNRKPAEELTNQRRTIGWQLMTTPAL